MEISEAEELAPVKLYGFLDKNPTEIKLPFMGTCSSVDSCSFLLTKDKARDKKKSKVSENDDGKETDYFVALKMVRLTNESDGVPLSSLREIMLLCSLNHENIVSVKDVVVGNPLNSIYLVLEYCEYDLAYIMDNSTKPWNLREIKCLLRQLLRGLDYCHQRKVIHRDIKLSNLLLTTDGVLKIADFGLARLYSDVKLKMTPKVVTLWYRAPELILGEDDYTTAVDLWSTGCVMGEWMKHSPLFPGETEQAQLDMYIDVLGCPNPKIWPEIVDLPYSRLVRFKDQPFPEATEETVNLLMSFLTYNPKKRITAADALDHEFFNEKPYPINRHSLKIPEFDFKQ
ncbi:kinase-like protein [Rozella allomycis CSF55]|uniref:Kinase-like protein n=1 Tax=Rozella allomycis (strain CSF55) TaxID=988480 RepID=A0A075AW16_ROZAC|nr:Protein kinase, catalytic domain-containing protein [Rozella allomycis CSF55]RKP18146.1 kinase-like protein [Rozella allomycis CSF55]|eukprot:EPZ32902.1 Protein kinase, catalytic domain-containing protein [Rozella allomycis CSF55]